MTDIQYPVVLTVENTAASDEDIVNANVSVVNAMYRALLGFEEIAPNALSSYFVDFYLTQVLDGGFAQYVFMSPDRAELDAYVREGFKGMGANGHLELFIRTTTLFDALSQDDAEAYLDGEFDGEGRRSEGVQNMETLDGEFETLLEAENVTGLNAAWLRGQDGLLVVSGSELNEHIAERVALIPNLAERQAEAAEADRQDAPEFEFLIRELCDMAGYELVRITMGDPNFPHGGATVLAWHFSTDHGDFIMIEGADEAIMIHPSTREIIASIDFEEAGELADA